MIHALVFSKDRALQLDATLTSFFLHAIGAAEVHMVVLYRSSSARHAAQYDQVAGQYRNRVRFVPETAFRRQVLEILKLPMQSAGTRRRDFLFHRLRATKEQQLSTIRHQVLFLVDDCVFVRPFRLEAAVQSLTANPDALGLSLRLGMNTRRCYVLDRPQALPEFTPLADGALKFRWSDADGDFAYPFEISSSLYPLGLLVDLLGRLDFRDPNTLESKMAAEARHFARGRPTLLCYPLSLAFCAPLNRVQGVFENRAGGAEKFSADRLADVFEQGRRINVRALEGFVPSACHQEVELAFE